MAIANGNPYQVLLRSRIKSAIEEARAASVLTHAGVKGSVLEILVRKLFRPLLPADIGVGSGQIIDAYGSSMSSQVDIVLYDRSILPPILMDETTGIFPIESVLYTIEVKTTLNATELKAAHWAAGKLAKFGYLPGLTDELGQSTNHPVERARSVIFALASDLTGTRLDEAQRYKNLYGESDAPLRAICVAGSGYWYDDGENWIGFKHPQEYDEVLGFIGGVTNTYKKVSESRHSPLLGNYVIPDVVGLHSIEARKVAKIPVTCDRCGKGLQLKPNLGKMDVVVNGTISSTSPCPECGGNLVSEAGKYRFVKGKYIPELVGTTDHGSE
ncbi:DUF6602 domain-containing protein [Solimonas sp. K1W22B-7]|uniref:DUF6602 domain-containing protein n=1 Tax=Solimonas sp. K1W22B-7 TaxID=2303331 RepID=UPI0013C4DBFE|nr:DUF6602 domain-containing protein [Solimonas sp. K1W22B-7]